VIERFARVSVPHDNVSFVRYAYKYNFQSAPSELVNAIRRYYSPTMNTFEAAHKTGRPEDLARELEALFESQNTIQRRDVISIPGKFLRVTIAVK
jgi:hypothetical protein